MAWLEFVVVIVVVIVIAEVRQIRVPTQRTQGKPADGKQFVTEIHELTDSDNDHDNRSVAASLTTKSDGLFIIFCPTS